LRSPPASAQTTLIFKLKIDRGITVAEVTYNNSISVSEHAVMMILELVRNYIPSYQWAVKGGWNIADCLERSYDVEGMHVGTVAAGRIGLAVLRREVCETKRRSQSGLINPTLGPPPTRWREFGSRDRPPKPRRPQLFRSGPARQETCKKLIRSEDLLRLLRRF
jgi:hypothetical protein